MLNPQSYEEFKVALVPYLVEYGVTLANNEIVECGEFTIPLVDRANLEMAVGNLRVMTDMETGVFQSVVTLSIFRGIHTGIHMTRISELTELNG